MKIYLISILYLLAIINFANGQQSHDHSHSEEDTHLHESSPAGHSHDTETHDHSHDAAETDHDHSSSIHNLETIRIAPTLYINTIKTTGMIKISPASETVIIAKSDGIVNFAVENLVTGRQLQKGTQLFKISGKDISGNNLDVQFTTAKNKYHQSKAALQRARSLIDDNIISQDEYLGRKSQFDADSIQYHILKKNYTTASLAINTPVAGEIYKLFVNNGDYITAGEKLAIISENHHNYLEVDVPKKYFHKRHEINSGNFKMEYGHGLHAFYAEAKMAEGTRLKPGSPFIPVSFSLDHNNELISGSFAEVWLNIDKTEKAVVVPKSALIEQQGLYFVFVKKGAEDFLKTPVKIESMNSWEAHIASGLHFGDEVVVSGVLELKLSQANSSVDPHAGHNH